MALVGPALAFKVTLVLVLVLVLVLHKGDIKYMSLQLELFGVIMGKGTINRSINSTAVPI